jgi:hypothetical protein
MEFLRGKRDASETLAQSYLEKLGTWLHYKALRNPDCRFAENAKLDRTICCCAAIEHPSMRRLNVHRRSFQGATGNDAEILLLKKLSATHTNPQ